MERRVDTCRVGDLVRSNRGAIEELVALGIGPRYLDWTLAATAADLGIGLELLVSRMSRFFAGERQVAKR